MFYSHRKITMTLTQTTCLDHITLCVGKKEVHSAEAGALAPMFEKSATKLAHKQKFLKCKSTIHILTFNFRNLNWIDQLPELTVSSWEHNIDIVCIKEHRYHHSELEIKYHNTGNGWMFISASIWRNLVNAVVGGVGMLLSPCALKSLNSIENIQLRMMVATFDGNPSIMIICYSPTNASDEKGLNTFCKMLYSLVHSIPKHNIFIIGGNMTVQWMHYSIGLIVSFPWEW